jgi:hypothetical protein
LYVELSSVDNLMIAVLCRFPGGQALYVELSSVDNLMQTTVQHTTFVLQETYTTQLSLGYLQKTVQHTTLVLQETYPHSVVC